MQHTRILLRLLSVLTAIAIVGAMKISYPVTMPLVAACFIIAAAWPIKNAIDARLPTMVSYVGTIIVLLAVFIGFCVLIYFTISQAASQLFDHQEEFRALYTRYTGWAEANGFPVIGPAADGTSGFDRMLNIGRSVLSDIYTLLSYLGLISVIVIMGLPEVPAMIYKFKHRFDRPINRKIFGTVRVVAQQFRSYLSMTVLASLITGAASAAFAFSVGLDLALTWGALNFLLNFVPVIGNIVGIIPPVLYATVQFGGWVMPLCVLAGFTLLQIVISNFIYPVLQGRGLSMPPVTITLSLLFWGWLWGLAGALLAVPLTACVIIVARQFPATEALGYLLTSEKPAEEENAQVE